MWSVDCIYAQLLSFFSCFLRSCAGDLFVFLFLLRDAAMLAWSWESEFCLSVRPSVCHMRTLSVNPKNLPAIFL